MTDLTFKAILFDLDGTLIDTAPDFYSVLRIMAQRHNRQPLDFTSVRQVVSKGAGAMVCRAFSITENHKDYPALRQQMLAIYADNLAVESCLFPGFDILLEHLKLKEIPWGIVTNKPRQYAEPLIAQLGLSQTCGSLVCPDDVTQRKPHPESLLLACKNLDTAPEDCIYIGDHQRDIAAGKAANMMTIAAEYGYIDHDDDVPRWQADHIADSSEAIAKLLIKNS